MSCELPFRSELVSRRQLNVLFEEIGQEDYANEPFGLYSWPQLTCHASRKCCTVLCWRIQGAYTNGSQGAC